MLTTQLRCECTPGKVFASKSTLQAHMKTQRHVAFASREEVRELRLRLAEKEGMVAKLQREVHALSELLRNPRRRSVSAHRKKEVAARAQWRCQACGQLVSENFEVDHRVPLFRGGSNDADNLQLLCLECHRRKTCREQRE